MSDAQELFQDFYAFLDSTNLMAFVQVLAASRRGWIKPLRGGRFVCYFIWRQNQSSRGIWEMQAIGLSILGEVENCFDFHAKALRAQRNRKTFQSLKAALSTYEVDVRTGL